MNQVLTPIDEDSLSLRDYVDIAHRRKWPMLGSMFAVAAVAILIALLLPAKYTSQATILIEEQDLPIEFVTSTISSYAAQQIQVISQRVLTAESIAGIADKFSLFRNPTTNRRPPSTQLAESFLELMALDLVSADVIDPRSGRPEEATIAFTLSFEHNSPRVAQQVTSELVTLFLDENLRTRTQRVANTEAFLASQANILSGELSTMEESIAEFKRDNGPALPELYQYNLSSLERRSAESSDVDRRIRELNTRKLELAAQMNLRNPVGRLTASDGGQLLPSTEQLTALRLELDQKSTLYLDSHPDIRSLRRRIAELEKVQTTAKTNPIRDVSTNPTYVLLETQLLTTNAEIESFLTKRSELTGRVEYFENLLSRSPSVERDYNSLIRDYETTQLRYQDVRAQQRSAEIAENMEQERRGERFTLVEPPDLPSEPTSPNRPVIALIGMMLAIGAGFAVAVTLEALDRSVHAEHELTKIMGMPPFAVVGYITTVDEIERQRRMRIWFLSAVVLSGLTILIMFHLLIKPLDVLWFSLLRNF